MTRDKNPYDSPESSEANTSAPDDVAPTVAGDETATAKLVAILDQYLADLKAGTAPTREELLKKHPELASQLDACLAGIDFINSTGEVGDDSSNVPQLADFRILREVGRGGMGAVYEAEQISLGRRVALKVLRFGAVSDPAALERFKREAETVATLHHTNIVPIFSFGCERGINYYAMQFIDGPSLDIVLRKSESPLDVQTVADWGLQAAEAMDHAHRRHVVHRDIKPSNLILDGENRVWLTDFGLAKRLDDVTLSRTGALLGTPRYMSPEQAAASKKEVDHRSDLYSLGATLYELLTRKPVFEGETYHAVIGKILDEDPISPRLHRPEIPRDLETILLKCLSKNPAHRYHSAADLAEDLRAFSQNRLISARRASLTELSVRWLQRNQRTAVRTALTVGVTACVILASAITWQSYSRYRQAELSLSSDEPLVAEIEDSAGNTRTIALPTREPVEVASGNVDIRLVGENKLTNNYRVEVSPGQQLKYEIANEGPRASNKIKVLRTGKLMATKDGVDVILLDEHGIRRYDPADSALLWSTDLAKPTAELLAHNSEFRWQWRDQGHFVLGEVGETYSPDSLAPDLSRQSIDVDSDGAEDIILAARNGGWLLALSGNSGKPLWFSSGKVSPTSSEQAVRTDSQRFATVFGPPTSLGDINNDGIDDLLLTRGQATLPSAAGDPQSLSDVVQDAQRWLEAVSGADGSVLWKCELDGSWFHVSAKETIPHEFCWFPTQQVNKTIGGSTGGYRRAGMIMRSLEREYRVHGLHAYAPGRPRMLLSAPRSQPIPATPDSNTNRIGILAGSHFAVIDAGTGKLVSAVDTGTRPIQPVIWQDVDGDALADAVILEKIASAQLRCSVWSLAKQESLWQRNFTARLRKFDDQRHLSAVWPLVADLNDDGRSELILPTDTSNPAGGRNPRVPWGQLEVLDGVTGETKWTRRILAMDQQINHFAVGPDLDGDNVREIFAAALWGQQFDLYVDALSGADGHSLWWNRYPLPAATSSASPDYILGKLGWWQTSVDGWPQLLAQAHDDNSNGLSKFCVISAGTGRLTRSILDVHCLVGADANGDGIEDLISYRKLPRRSATDPAGELQVFTGAAERWRRLAGLQWSVAPDLDADGVHDLISQSRGSRSPVHRAISGLTGDVLWQTRGNGLYAQKFSDIRNEAQSSLGAKQKHRDLDGDGVPDLLAWYRMGAGRRTFKPIRAVSGRTGRDLWKADISVSLMAAAPLLDIRDLDHDGTLEVIVVAAMDWGYGWRTSYGTDDQQLWLAILDGSSGRLRWKHPLSPAYSHLSATAKLRFKFDDVALVSSVTDLNDDGVLDLVVPAAVSEGEFPVELRAIDGRNGSLLWKHALPSMKIDGSTFSRLSQPTLADLDRDGKPELLVMAADEIGSPTRQHHLLALHRDGKVRWQWQGETPNLFDQYQADPLMRRGPVVFKTKSGDPLVSLPFTSGKKLVLLDHQGQIAVEQIVDRWTEYRIWSADGDQNGVDELVLASSKDLRVTAPADFESPLWQTTFATRPDPRHAPQVIGLQTGVDDKPPVILLRDGPAHNSVSGIDVMTGRIQWRSPGPQPWNRFGQIRLETIAVLNDQGTLPPQIFCRTGHVAQVRQAVVTMALKDGKVRAVTPPKQAPTLTPHKTDPRLRRQLPWIRYLSQLVEAAATYWFWGTVYCVTIIVLPCGFLLSMLVRRRWGLRTMALLPVVTAMFLMGILVDGPEPVMFSAVNKLLFGLGFLPILCFVGSLSYLLLVRQFARLGFWLGSAALAALVMAGLFLWANSGGDPWLPGERYSLQGWYWIGFAGAYLTGCAMLSLVPGAVRSVEKFLTETMSRVSGHVS